MCRNIRCDEKFWKFLNKAIVGPCRLGLVLSQSRSRGAPSQRANDRVPSRPRDAMPFDRSMETGDCPESWGYLHDIAISILPSPSVALDPSSNSPPRPRSRFRSPSASTFLGQESGRRASPSARPRALAPPEATRVWRLPRGCYPGQRLRPLAGEGALRCLAVAWSFPIATRELQPPALVNRTGSGFGSQATGGHAPLSLGLFLPERHPPASACRF